MTWPAAIAEAAKASSIALPQATQRGMGSVLWRNRAGHRFVSFRPLLGSPPDPQNARARWSLWHDEKDRPRSVLAFQVPLRPVPELIPQVTAALAGWLLEQWSAQDAVERVAGFANVELPPKVPERSSNEYWLSENHEFGFTIEDNGWELRAGARSLSMWKSKVDDSRGRLLLLAQLDRLGAWLARHWYVIAYGKEPRPPVLRERAAAACRAYQDTLSEASAEQRPELHSWWEKHALRAADPDLPNVFLERQGDDLVISWDDSSSETRTFLIPYGTEITSARFAVPILRRLVASRLGNVEVEPKVERRVTTVDPDAGYHALSSTFPPITPQWLIEHRFTDEDAREMALTGTASHPVVGLLRSAQGSELSPADFDAILAMLQLNSGERFQNLRALAKGMNANIDLREPWQSGYHLARLVRAELGQKETGYIDIETVVQQMNIDVRDIPLTDATILAACVGSLQFAPLIAINLACDDARGPSGRRITLAHELCHLLFDRSRMRSFARFEGAAADSDRLIEMRANAFAVELLAPIKSFVKPDGTLMSDEDAEKLSLPLAVSTVAIRRHVQNHRNEQQRRRYRFFN
jgi:Zn-dependent peptidase ImmA (M78 family)